MSSALQRQLFQNRVAKRLGLDPKTATVASIFSAVDAALAAPTKPRLLTDAQADDALYALAFGNDDGDVKRPVTGQSAQDIADDALYAQAWGPISGQVA